MRRPRTLVVGGGGREHAIAAALHRSEAPLFVAGPHENPGLRALAQEYHVVGVEEGDKIVAWAKQHRVELAVLGPEAAIEAGVADKLRAAKIPTVGPSAAAGRIESSKSFARELMAKHVIPGLLSYHVVRTPAEVEQAVASFPREFVVKASGLAAGKGVFVQGPDFSTPAEGAEMATKLLAQGGAGRSVVLEEKLEGEEFSLLAFVDGTTVHPMPVVQDYKRALEGDKGPNTGGMGSYSERDHLLPFLPKADLDKAVEILQAVVAALKQEGLEYRGILYGGFMLTAGGPQVLEFNSRFGDPEALNVLTLFDGTDFADLLLEVANGKVDPVHVSFRRRATVCKYLVPTGYPATPKKGAEITFNAQKIQDLGVSLYFAAVTPGPATDRLLTQTSRALALVGEASARKDADARVEEALKFVQGDFYVRHDVGSVADVKARTDHMARLRHAPPFDPLKNPTRSGPTPPPIFT